MNNLESSCLLKAQKLIETGVVVGVDLFKLTDTLISLELEKAEKNEKTDRLIDYNDSIISIEEVGELETTDISVSGDNLFYCNGILTKNSFGLPATADLMIALISTENLEKANQLMVKQLKNRYNDATKDKRFIIGVDRSKMRLYDVDDSAQTLSSDSSPAPQSESRRIGGPSSAAKFSGFKTT